MKKSNNPDILERFPISIFIITSHRDNDTVYNFLESKNFFQHENLSVCYQEDLTVIDNFGKMKMKDKTSILKCPTGTGGIFSTMQKYKLSREANWQLRTTSCCTDTSTSTLLTSRIRMCRFVIPTAWGFLNSTTTRKGSSFMIFRMILSFPNMPIILRF